VSYFFKGVFCAGMFSVASVAIFGITCVALLTWHRSDVSGTPVSQAGTPVLQTTPSPTPVVNAPTPDATPSPIATPLPITTPSPIKVKTEAVIDTRLVGQWHTNDRSKSGVMVIWDISADGSYKLSFVQQNKNGTLSAADTKENKNGTLSTADGKIEQYFTPTQITMELLYKVDGVKLVTTAPDGTETTWSFAGPFPAATPEGSARKHAAPSSINTWWHHFFPFGN